MAIRAYTDTSYEGFTSFPANETEAAEALANAFYQYSLTITPACVTQAAARDAMKAALSGMSAPGAAPAIISAAAASFATAILMAGYTAAPPAAPLDLSGAAAIGLAGGTAQACAIQLGVTIDAWFKTGTATNGSTTINWL